MADPPSNDDLASWDAASRLVALVDRARPRYQRGGLACLNEAERTLLALFDFDNEVCHGGFGQWLFQTPQDVIAITPECLARIGETEVLRLVRSILGELGSDALVTEWPEWEQHFHRMPEGFWERIAAYDRACGPLERGLVKRLWSYAAGVVADIRST
jgi:hypothetical protein